ncbi:MAG: hypothetical protein KatS3mg015_1846 [Fimbriimonadales bacterium]|nr:MAG: hypothetical protein KatS3mg015_1846 [Fimbriimonadales bacterium]
MLSLTVGCALVGALPSLAQRPETVARLRHTIEQIGELPRVGVPPRDVLEYLSGPEALGRFQPVGKETFSLPIPAPTAIGELRLNSGEALALYPLWPNGVRTSSCDVEGRLVYGGRGSFRELQGKPILGSVVVLEFNSGSNWKNVASLGAAAVLFLAPESTTRYEGEKKWSSLPLDVPRFYVRPEDRQRVLDATDQRIRLRCRQPWLRAEGVNLYAKIRGADTSLRNEWVVLSAHMDSVSCVPGLPHGADQAAGLATLLEVARWLEKEPPKRSVLFLLTSGHYQGMAGIREFLEARFRKGWDVTDGNTPVCFFFFDPSSGSDTLAAHAQGWWLRYRMENYEGERGIVRTMRDRLRPFADAQGVPVERLLVDAVNNPDGRDWRNSIPAPFAAECEIVNQAGLDAVSFLTAEDGRALQDTPFDRADSVNFRNLARQVETLIAGLRPLLNEPSDTTLGTERSVPYQTRQALRRMTLMGGFCTVAGRVVSFDPRRNFFPNVPEPGALVSTVRDKKTLLGVRGTMLAIADEAGRYELHGMPPVTLWEESGRFPLPVYAFQIGEDGRIRKASDMGVQGGQFETYFQLTTAYRNVPIVVFEGKPVAVMRAMDPLTFRALPFPTVLSAHSDGEPRRFSIFFPPENPFTVSGIGEAEGALWMFVDPEEPFKILATSWDGSPRLALIHSTETNPSGIGYAPEPPDFDDEGGMVGPTLSAARDLVALNRERYELLARHRIVSPAMEQLQTLAQARLGEAEEAYQERAYAESERSARAAWGLALRLHPILLSTARDALYGLLFYLALLVPFAFIVERLLFPGRNLSDQIVRASAVFVACFVALRFFHPAFEITNSTLVIFVAFTMGILSVIVISFLLSRFEAFVQPDQSTQSKAPTVAGLFFTALSVSIASMRRRPIRTFLTVLTLLVVMVSVLTFTSIVPGMRFNALPSEGTPSYAGILFRSPAYDPLEENAVSELEIEFPDARVLRRVWFHGAQPGAPVSLTLRYGDQSASLTALLGVDSAERYATRLDQALVAGRWFGVSETEAILLPSSVASKLGIGRNDVGTAKVVAQGRSLTVIGLLDDDRLQAIRDLDNEGLMPADFAQSDLLAKQGEAGPQQFRRFVRLKPEQSAVVPAQTLLEIGGRIRSLSVVFDEGGYSRVRSALEDLMPRTDLTLYASVEENGTPVIRKFSALAATEATGLHLTLIPVLIAIATVLNTMVASVLERRREIAILSAIGLSPKQVALLFRIEALVYGVIAVIGGYVCAQLLASALTHFGWMEDFAVNYSSLSALVATLIVAGVVLVSAWYPSRVAARIASPGEGEHWKLAVPEGDRIENRLPFTVTRQQASSLSEHLHAWFLAHQEYGIGTLSTEWVERTEGGIKARIWLAPFDLGVYQTVEFLFPETDTPGIHAMILRVDRLSGDPQHWVTTNKRFLDAVRREFLLWRTMQSRGGETAKPAELHRAAEEGAS